MFYVAYTLFSVFLGEDARRVGAESVLALRFGDEAFNGSAARFRALVSSGYQPSAWKRSERDLTRFLKVLCLSVSARSRPLSSL